MFSFSLSISHSACFTSSVVEIWLNIVLIQLIAWVITCPFCKSLQSDFLGFLTLWIAVGSVAFLVQNTHRWVIAEPRKYPRGLLVPPAAPAHSHQLPLRIKLPPFPDLWALLLFFPGSSLDSLKWPISSFKIFHYQRQSVGAALVRHGRSGFPCPCSQNDDTCQALPSWEGPWVSRIKVTLGPPWQDMGNSPLFLK